MSGSNVSGVSDTVVKQYAKPLLYFICSLWHRASFSLRADQQTTSRIEKIHNSTIFLL